MTRDIEHIVDNLQDTVRFEQNTNPLTPTLPTSLTEPATARLVYHPLLTTDNLVLIAPDFKNYQYAQWDIGTIYNTGDIVKQTNNNLIKFFSSLVDNNVGNDPATAPAGLWQELDFFADWLTERRKQAIRNFFNSVFNKKKDERQTKILLDTLNLYEAPGSIVDKEVKRGRLVGFQIRLLNHNNINVVLERLRTQFDTIQNPGLTFRLYHSSQLDPVATLDLVTTKANSAEWTNLTDASWLDSGGQPDALANILQYQEYENDIQGGLWFLTYQENELQGQAINARYLWGRPGSCAGCSRYNYKAYQKWSQFVEIRAFSVAAGKFDDVNNTLWDIRSNTYAKDTNFGLNLSISAYCELKDYIVDQKVIFAEGIAQQLTVDLLKELANNTRSNRISENTRVMSKEAMANSNIGGENEIKRLEQKLDAANFELSDIQKSSCIPCLPSKGMSIKSVNSGGRSPYSGGGGRYW